MSSRWNHLWLNLSLATMAPGGAPYGHLDGALAVAGDRIASSAGAATCPARPIGSPPPCMMAAGAG
jgi:hypothetical protein